MRVAILLAALALAGCKSAEVREAERAERAVQILTQNFDLAERCNAERRAAAAWLRAGDAEKYSRWKARAEDYCLSLGM